MLEHYELTNHASTRMQQRGVMVRSLEFVLENADKSEFVGSGCREQWISRRHLATLRRKGEDRRLIDRADSIAVVLSEDGAIVTIYHKTDRTRHKKNKQRGCQKRLN